MIRPCEGGRCFWWRGKIAGCAVRCPINWTIKLAQVSLRDKATQAISKRSSAVQTEMERLIIRKVNKKIKSKSKKMNEKYRFTHPGISFPTKAMQRSLLKQLQFLFENSYFKKKVWTEKPFKSMIRVSFVFIGKPSDHSLYFTSGEIAVSNQKVVSVEGIEKEKEREKKKGKRK
jgi:hypothetical protein